LVDGLIEERGKIQLIGKSKTFKSYMALELALCLGTGRDFLGLGVPGPVKVLYIQFEILDHHLHRRIRTLAPEYEPGILQDRLLIRNVRNLSPTPYGLAEIKADLASTRQLDGEAEQGPTEMNSLLKQVDELIAEFNCAVLIVHHDPKGDNSSFDISDHGSGTSNLGRDYDSRIVLLRRDQHTEKDLIEVRFSTRNDKPPNDLVAEFIENRFKITDLIAGTKRKKGFKLLPLEAIVAPLQLILESEKAGMTLREIAKEIESLGGGSGEKGSTGYNKAKNIRDQGPRLSLDGFIEAGKEKLFLDSDFLVVEAPKRGNTPQLRFFHKRHIHNAQDWLTEKTIV